MADAIRRIDSYGKLAIGALVLFGAVGAAILDDYGVSIDERTQRALAEANWSYVLGDDGALPGDNPRYGFHHHHRYYSVAIELPLLLVERVLGMEDSRSAHLLRHAATHLLHLCGGFACFLLARRLFGSGPPALLAMLLFLLHPRLYAHSFFNSKDLPFASMFMIALYLLHRAFEKNTIRAFVVLGAGIGLLVNLRIAGLMLFAAALVMRGCDLLCVAGRRERRRMLTTGGAFAASAAATLYVVSPYMWSDPLEFVEMVRTFSLYQSRSWQLFQGEFFFWNDLPWRYVPTWMAVTTPPVTLALGCAGVAAVAWRGAARPGQALRNTPLRFGFLLVACLAAPALVAAALKANLYDGWRHMYFLHAPLCLLAAWGLRWLASAGAPASAGRHGRPPWDGARTRRAAYALTGVAVVGIVVAMMRIHPYQNVYFNFLVDRTRPQHLRTQYDMAYWWATAPLDAIRHLAGIHPSSRISALGRGADNWRLLPEEQRKRMKAMRWISSFERRFPDFVFSSHREHVFEGRHPPATYGPVIYARQAYGSTIATVYGVNPSLLNELHADRFRETYRSATSGPPAVRARYDVYVEAGGGALTYARAPCVPSDLDGRIFLHVVPVDAGDLPEDHVQDGFDNLDFNMPAQAMYDGKCLATTRLPQYAVDHVRTGQTRLRDGEWIRLWEETIRFRP